MRPLNEMPLAAAAQVHTVLSDIDDTLTTDGYLTPAAYAALAALREQGLRVILVTGRPAGWCDHIARMWPVDGVIGENGAFYLWYDRQARKLRTRHSFSACERASNAARLAEVRDKILSQVPGCAMATDQFCRLYDLAIDFSEDVAALPDSAVACIVSLMQETGMKAMVSSIHVNGWFGPYDKLAMAKLMLQERYNLDADQASRGCVYVGDSPNDAPMFGHFPLAVGVANLAKYGNALASRPAYVCSAECGAGFVELSGFLLDARQVGNAAAPGRSRRPAGKSGL